MPDVVPSSKRTAEAALEARNRQVAAVHTITRLLSSTLDLDERLRDILEVSMEAVDAVAGSILLQRPSDGKLVFQYVVGPRSRDLTGYAMPITDGLAGQVFTSGTAAITNHPEREPGHRADIGAGIGLPSECILTVPLKHRDDSPIGVIQLVNKQSGEFDDDDLEVVEIVAAVAATAIENARRHRVAQMEAVGHAMADMSHHVRNKVTPISVAADTLRQMIEALLADLDAVGDDACRSVRTRLQEAARPLREFHAESHEITHDQVREIQDYAKVVSDALHGVVSEPQLQPHDLARIVERQLAVLEPGARRRGIRLVRSLRPVPMCRFDRTQVESAVYHLVCNALEAAPDGGTVTVATRAILPGDPPEDARVVVEVTDDGCGLSPALLAAVLTGEAKTSKPGRTGLGTRIAYYTAQAHNGAFEGISAEGEGTTLRLVLPLRGMSLMTLPATAQPGGIASC